MLISGTVELLMVLHLVTMWRLLMKRNLLNDNSHENKLQMNFTDVLSFSNRIQEHLVMCKQKDI